MNELGLMNFRFVTFFFVSERRNGIRELAELVSWRVGPRVRSTAKSVVDSTAIM